MANILLANPAPRRKKTASRKPATRKPAARKPIRRRRTSKKVASIAVRQLRYRRNPVRQLGGIMSQVQDAAIGAAGALAVDFAMGKLPLPIQMQVGAMRPATQGLVSIVIGMLVSNVMRNRKLGAALAGGGLTVALYGVGKTTLANVVPGLAGVDDLSGDLLGNDGQLLGASYQDASMGWVSPAPVSYGGENYGFSGSDSADLDSYQNF